MRVFPSRWFHVDADIEIFPTPLDASCAKCGERFVEGDRGVELPYFGEPHDPFVRHYHRECFLLTLGFCVVCNNNVSFAGCKACGTFRG